MYQDLIRNELNEAAETLANFLKDDANIHAIQRAAVLLADSFKAGGKVLSCGQRRFPLRRYALCRRVDRSLP
ncbi:phosphoheptose isomerase [Escherichia coli]|uniref:Phosphoheptose isomerase n=1 Tax=Escherichia coli TaxID=562 RepID=A0A376U3A1_ECOLX|nr:phosphoheptose isomerase [Escherichia coli]